MPIRFSMNSSNKKNNPEYKAVPLWKKILTRLIPIILVVITIWPSFHLTITPGVNPGEFSIAFSLGNPNSSSAEIPTLVSSDTNAHPVVIILILLSFPFAFIVMKKNYLHPDAPLLPKIIILSIVLMGISIGALFSVFPADFL